MQLRPQTDRNGIGRALCSVSKSSRTAWFEALPDADKGKPSLFCFPHAGGSSVAFEGWKTLLAETLNVRPIQLPGRGTQIRVPAEKRLQPLIEGISHAIAQSANGPVALFGHSMGALLAWAVCRALESEQGLVASHLFASGRVPPEPGMNVSNSLHTLPDDELIAQLREFKGMPGELLQHHEFLRLMLPTIRADFEAVETYCWPRPYVLSTPITALTGSEDMGALPARMKEWKRYTRSQFALEVVQGGHFFVYEAFPSVIRIIQKRMAG